MGLVMELKRSTAAKDLRVDIAETTDLDLWDGRLQTAAAGSYRQSAMFGQHQAERCCEQSLFIRASDGEGQVVGQLLARIGAPFSWGIRRRFFGSLALPLLARRAPCMYWGDGPVVFEQESSKEIYRALVCGALQEASRRGCIGVEAWPAFYGEQEGLEREWQYQLFAESGFQSAPGTTLVVDLRKEEEALWQGVRKEGRNKVRKALKQGVEIKELGCDETLFTQAHSIIRETAMRNNVASWPEEEMRQALRFHGSRGVFRAFIALHEGHPIAYQHVTFFNRNAQLGGVAYSDYSRQARIYGNDLMQWHVLQAMHQQGVQWLDYGGADPDSEDPKVRGIYQFKAKWGGDLVRCNRFRLVAGVGRNLSPRGLLRRLYEKGGRKTYGSA
jgi:hypothetical protein